MTNYIKNQKTWAFHIVIALLLGLWAWISLPALVATPPSAAAYARSEPQGEGPYLEHGRGIFPVSLAQGCEQGFDVVSSPNIAENHNTLNDVTVVSPNDIWSVGQYYANSNQPIYNTLIQHWNGSTWSIVPSPNVQGTSNSLYGVAALSANDIWAVGAVGEFGTPVLPSTLIQHWNGSTWSTVPSPNPGEGRNILYSVTAISTNDVWAVGVGGHSGSGRPLILHWNGTAWSLVTTPSPGGYDNALLGVAAVSATDVWAVGTYTNVSGGPQYTLMLHWDGAQWSIVPSPNPGSAFTSVLNDVTVVSQNDIWAVGRSSMQGGTTQTLIEHWDGVQWSIVPSPNPNSTGSLSLLGVEAVSASDIWAVGYFYSTSGNRDEVLIEHWDGVQWSIIPGANPNPYRNSLSEIAVVTGIDIWAVGVAGATGGGFRFQTLVEHYTNTCVTVTPTGIPNVSPTPTPDCRPRFVIVPSPDQGTSRSSFYDGGISALAPNDVWAVGSYNNTSGIRQTLIEHWDGVQWSIVPSPNGSARDNLLTAVSALAPNDVWAVGGYVSDTGSRQETLVLHWDGVQWSIVPSINAGDGNNYLAGVSALAPNDVWAVGYYQSFGSPATQRTLAMHWNGASWSIAPTPAPGDAENYLYGVSANSPTDIWAVGDYRNHNITGERTLIMHWDGNVWAQVASPNPAQYSNYMHAVTAISTNDVWAVGRLTGDEGVVPVIMHWNGASWSVVPNPRAGSGANYLYGISGVNSNDIWAVGYYSYGTNSPTQTLVEHWNGIAWSIVPSPSHPQVSNYLTTVSVLPTGEVWTAGGYYNSSNVLRTLVERYSSSCLPTATYTPAPTPTPCTPGIFSDVPPGSTFYPYVTCLVNRGIISGYSDCTFRPNNEVTRGQLAKIVSNAAGFTESPDPQIFEDVPLSNTFYEWINRLARRGHMSGYACGGVGEPCTTGRPYFRPSANATRGQTSKIVSNAAGYSEIPTDQTFEDVPPTHTFYNEIQRLATRNIMAGYPCGGAGEPCISGRAYFRPQNNVTRGQSAKIVANTFFPNCQTP